MAQILRTGQPLTLCEHGGPSDTVHKAHHELFCVVLVFFLLPWSGGRMAGMCQWTYLSRDYRRGLCRSVGI